MELQLEPQTGILSSGTLLQQKLTLHHVGILVKNLDEAVATYRDIRASIFEAGVRLLATCARLLRRYG
jgi:hypothetical protein